MSESVSTEQREALIAFMDSLNRLVQVKPEVLEFLNVSLTPFRVIHKLAKTVDPSVELVFAGNDMKGYRYDLMTY